MAYECLIEAGYTHEDILVFFGQGNNWENTSIHDNRYKLSEKHSDWGDIVDFPNDEETVEDEIGNFADNIITEKDNLLIWYPRGHGSSNSMDNYYSYVFQESPVHHTWNFGELS